MIVEKIFEHACKQPHKPAMYYRGYRITYGEFAFWIANARQFFMQQELRGGTVAVFVTVPCRLDAWAMDFALRSLGIDTIAVAAPEELGELNLRNIGCVITTVGDRPIPVPPGADCKLIRIPQPLYLGKAAGPVPEPLELKSPAGGHIMLTSGTTGARKKVLISEQSLSIRTARQSDIYGISANSLVNIFDFAMWTGAGYKLPLSVWSAGGAVVFHQDEGPHQSLLIGGITHAVITPAKLSEVLNAPNGELPRLPNMLLSAAGAPLTRALAKSAAARITPRIFASVASTEVGIWALTRIETLDDLHAHRVHPSIEVQIVDDRDRVLPAGQVGTIRVRAGDGVTGYMDDEAASRQIFRHGFFYPGDLGEFRLDGRLVLHGRASSVISVRGNKMLAEPIEWSLQEKLGADAVCIISTPGDGAQEDVHVVIQSRGVIGQAEAASFIKTNLPAFPPVRIHLVEVMPRNDMGKIDRLTIRRQISAMTGNTMIASDRLGA